ncbi:hypothetical protein GCM10028809_32500 [Spirosoma gilvum]
MKLLLTCEISTGVPAPIGLLTGFEDKLNEHFKAKNYGESVQTIYGSFVCVSAEYEFLNPIRKPRLLRKEPSLEFEYRLDFNTYRGMDNNERLRYIATGYYNNLKATFAIRKAKRFDSEAFLKDVERYLLHCRLLTS